LFIVYTACGDTNARCFDAKSGALKRTFKGHTGSINCLRVSYLNMQLLGRPISNGPLLFKDTENNWFLVFIYFICKIVPSIF
jgi:WD40 repeat protein